MNLTNYLSIGLRNTLKLASGVHFSHKGSWTIVYENTVIDQWHVGDFMSADYTISVDLNTNQKEIIRCLVVAGPDNANVTIYGKTSLDDELITLSAIVDSSRLYLKASPKANMSGSKLIFSAHYFQTINELHT